MTLEPQPTMDKAQLRQAAKARRALLDMDGIGEEIRHHMGLWTTFHAAQTILAFAALPGEVDLMPLMSRFANKHWYLPRVISGEELMFHRYAPGQTLVKSRFGILEPTPEAPALPSPHPIDLILVPALMLDRAGFRLGFGRGYYDRFLTRLAPQRVMTACPVASDLLVTALPREALDIPVQWGITEHGVFRCPESNGNNPF